MKQIQLYIEDQRVELFKDESVVLTQTVQNVRDVGKVFTPFSRSFTVPASKNNNKIFKHFYNFNIIDSVDPRLRMDARIDLNFSRFEKGKIKLDGVKMKNNKPYAYKITFFGNTVTLRDKFRNDKLDALAWLKNFSFSYSNTNVIDTLKNGKDVEVDGVTYEKAFVVPLITHEDRLIYDTGSAADKNLFYNASTFGGVNWQQLKPAIRMSLLIKAIEKEYDIEFSDDFFSEDNPAYNDLYMWMHRRKGKINQSSTGDDVYKDNFGFPFRTWGGHYGFQTHGQGYRIYNVQATPSWSGGSVQNPSDPPLHPTSYNVTHRIRPVDDSLEYTIVIDRNGQEIHRSENVTGDQDITIEHEQNGSVVIEVQSTNSMAFEAMELFVIGREYYGSTKYTTFQGTPLNLAPDFTFDTTKEIPEIKVIDFLSGLFKMFNLVAFLDYDEKIIVKTLDDWYADSDATHDITEYIDATDSTIDVALPYREILFDYAGKESFFAKNHNALFNYEHGVERYRGEDDELLSGQDYKIQIPFEHHKYERLVNPTTGSSTTVQWGWSVDDNQSSILGKPLLFYPIRQTGGTTIAVQSSTVAHEPAATYFVPSNSRALDASISSENINFKAERNEYTNTVFSDTLFSKYYRDYISDTFDPSRRLSKFKARLPMSFLLNYELNDDVIIFDRLYRINQIQTNLATGISQIELINRPESEVAVVDDTNLYVTIDVDGASIDNQSVTIDTDSASNTYP